MSQTLIITPQQFNEAQRRIGSATQRRERRAKYIHERQQRAKQEHERLAHPGRPARRAEGGWVTDMAECKSGILLCRKCSPKFDPERYHYYRTTEFLVHGPCDGCKSYSPPGQTTFFIHQSFVGQKHGQCWKPR